MRDYTRFDGYLNELYDDIYPQTPDEGHTKLAQKVINQWMSRMTTCHSVLDVGAGEGFCQPMFEGWGKTYEGVALGEDYIKAHEDGRNVKNMDFHFLDYADDSFDMVFSRHSLEHSPMPLLALMEWERVARYWLGIILPAPEWYGFGGRNHYSVMTHPQIEFLLECAGWRPIWNSVDQRPVDEKRPSPMKPHEYWIMCEKSHR